MGGGRGFAAGFFLTRLARVATDFVTKIVGHGTPAADLARPHPQPGQQMNANPYPEEDRQSGDGDDGI